MKNNLLELLSYDMDNGFTYIGEQDENHPESLKNCCVIPTEDLIYNNMNNASYYIEAKKAYYFSRKNSNIVRINPDKIVATHEIEIPKFN